MRQWYSGGLELSSINRDKQTAFLRDFPVRFRVWAYIYILLRHQDVMKLFLTSAGITNPSLKNEFKEVSKKLEGDLYALDDNSAVLWIDGKIKVISEGIWKKY